MHAEGGKPEEQHKEVDDGRVKQFLREGPVGRGQHEMQDAHRNLGRKEHAEGTESAEQQSFALDAVAIDGKQLNFDRTLALMSREQREGNQREQHKACARKEENHADPVERALARIVQHALVKGILQGIVRIDRKYQMIVRRPARNFFEEQRAYLVRRLRQIVVRKRIFGVENRIAPKGTRLRIA